MAEIDNHPIKLLLPVYILTSNPSLKTEDVGKISREQLAMQMGKPYNENLLDLLLGENLPSFLTIKLPALMCLPAKHGYLSISIISSTDV